MRRTDLCVSFHFHDLHAFDNCGARIVDAIHHRLQGELAWDAVEDMQRLEHTFNWIIVRSFKTSVSNSLFRCRWPRISFRDLKIHDPFWVWLRSLVRISGRKCLLRHLNLEIQYFQISHPPAEICLKMLLLHWL